MERRPLTLRNRVLSFQYAAEGMWQVFRRQPNMWIISAITVFVVITGFLLKVSPLEWCFLLSAISLVWIAEVFNTALEFLVDLASPEFHLLAKKAKDSAAGAVLIAVILALLIGIIILGPKFYYLFTS